MLLKRSEAKLKSLAPRLGKNRNVNFSEERNDRKADLSHNVGTYMSLRPSDLLRKNRLRSCTGAWKSVEYRGGQTMALVDSWDILGHTGKLDSRDRCQLPGSSEDIAREL